jgi:hypothetical protein
VRACACGRSCPWLPAGALDRSGNPVPAQFAGLPAGDCPVAAHNLDCPQTPAAAAHDPLGLDYPGSRGRLRDLPFSAGLPNEHKIGRVSIAPGVAVLARSRCASRHVVGPGGELAAAPGRAAKCDNHRQPSVRRAGAASRRG